MHKRIMIIAGEPSGDLHGSNLARAILSLSPGCELFGIGGEKMRKAGVKTFQDIAELSVVGFFDVIRNIRKIKRVFKETLAKLDVEKPDALVLIDYPGFNLHLAKYAKRRGIKIIYYISPQIWAWAPGRIKAIKKSVDRMMVAFEFEKKIYEDAGVPVEFVGHPLLDAAEAPIGKEESRRALGLREKIMTIGILPGSRMSEVKRHLPVMLGAAEILKDVFHDEVQFVVSRSPILPDSLYAADAASKYKALNYNLAAGNIYELISACDFVLTSSGTATLETAIMGAPMVVIYRVSPLSWFFFRRLVKIPNIAMVNIVAGERLVPELLQGEAAPQKIAKEALEILGNREKKEKISAGLGLVREKLGTPGASMRAARVVLKTLINADALSASPNSYIRGNPR